MDKALYDDKWQDVIRPEILKRDNYKCQDCGLQHKKYILRDKKGAWKYIEPSEYAEYCTLKMRAYRVYLQVAHLDSVKTNNDPSNLRTLCLWCHLKYNKAHKQLMRLAQKKSKHLSSLIDTLFDQQTYAKSALIAPSLRSVDKSESKKK